jgi:hypothetical protein
VNVATERVSHFEVETCACAPDENVLAAAANVRQARSCAKGVRIVNAPEQSPVCSKCGGRLCAGSVLAPSYSWIGLVLQRNAAGWYAGQPVSGFWGPKLPEEKHAITAYRCVRCGHLDLYAQGEAA